MTENEKYLEWKEFVRDEELASDLNRIESNEEEIFDCFYRTLDFGTAGLRGIMQAGTNGMNLYTVAQATKGLATLVSKSGGENRVRRRTKRIFRAHRERTFRGRNGNLPSGQKRQKGRESQARKRRRLQPLYGF